MFSGIIETLGIVRGLALRERDMTLTVSTGMTNLALGESIAVNGVCLTVVEDGGARLAADGPATFHVSAETLARTALGRLKEGDRVNLERACTPATRLSGHIVQGHVDGIGHLASVEEIGESKHLTIRLPSALRPYVVEKGSIALDGISLTVNALGDVREDTFPIHLMIIPHTWAHTALGELAMHDPLNVEVDVLAKYVESLLARGTRP